mmetsp:Transcript_2317/g.6014  ORF Transcript_2317/g.6014 Transcript_2317/m.6014 type:complete len:307 (-) Transcript_2317:502-1422(-)
MNETRCLRRAHLQVDLYARHLVPRADQPAAPPRARRRVCLPLAHYVNVLRKRQVRLVDRRIDDLEELILGAQHLRLVRDVAARHHAPNRVADVAVVALALRRAEHDENEANGWRLGASLVLGEVTEVGCLLEPHKCDELVIEEAERASEHFAGFMLAVALGRWVVRLGGRLHNAQDPRALLHHWRRGERVAVAAALLVAALRAAPIRLGGRVAVRVLAPAESVLEEVLLALLRGVNVLRLQHLHHLVAVLICQVARRDHVLDECGRDEVERLTALVFNLGGELEVDEDGAAHEELAQRDEVVELHR